MTKRELIQALEETPLSDDTPVLLKVEEHVVSLEVVKGVELIPFGTSDKVFAIWLGKE